MWAAMGQTINLKSLIDIGIDTRGNIDGTPFTWEQALVQGTTGYYAVPTPPQQENIIRQAHALHPVFNLLGGFRVSSWLRSIEHNMAVGGAAQSMHLTGLATDIVHLTLTSDQVRLKVKQSGLYPGRTELDAQGWCHYDLKNNQDFYGRPNK